MKRKLFCLVLVVLFLNYVSVFATTYYVSGNGNDNNNGLSTSSAFRTIQKAANLTNPGDTVYVMNGTYTNRPYEAVVYISRSGTSSAWITYKAYPDHTPKIKFNYWQGFGINSASYIEINGFDIEGNNKNVTLEQCKQNGGAECNGNGISLDGRKVTDKPHHIRILNNTIHDCGAGIASIQSDYISIEHNTIYNNSWYSKYATSGISTWQNWRFDENAGYKMFIRYNVVYNNYTQIPWEACNCISDGNGIIIDDSKNTQNGSTLGPYTGRTLVANNIVFNNGGSGIHSYMSEHVDIVNNTAYLNSRVLSNYGAIFANNSNDVKILNNILYAGAGKAINSNNSNSNVIYDYNLYFGGNKPVVVGLHDLISDPKFVNPSIDPATANFHLQQGSPAIDSGTSIATLRDDIEGNSRPKGSRYDRGAYEFNPPVPQLNFTIRLNKNWNLISSPIEPTDTDIANVLAPINGLFQVVYAWNGASYESYYPGSSSNTLTKVVSGRGYWIFMKDNADLVIKGQAAGKDIALKESWNLVGYNSTTQMSVNQALSSLIGKVTSIYAYDANSGRYETVEIFEPGRGYWVFSTTNTIWTLP
jgi:parallel beta-helix repeat protein